jgi:hypothetical protein
MRQLLLGASHIQIKSGGRKKHRFLGDKVQKWLILRRRYLGFCQANAIILVILATFEVRREHCWRFGGKKPFF